MRKGRWVDYAHMMMMMQLYPQECWDVALLCLISSFDFSVQDCRIPKSINNLCWGHVLVLQSKIIEESSFNLVANYSNNWHVSQLMECYTEMVRTGGEWGQDIAVLKDNIDSDSLPCTSHFCECRVRCKSSSEPK